MRHTILWLFVLTTMAGCSLFRQSELDSAPPAAAAAKTPGLEEGRIVRMAIDHPKGDEKDLLYRVIKSLHQTQQLGLAASRARAGESRVVFDYLYFDLDVQAMIAAIEEYLAARDTGPRTPRPVRALRLNYTHE